MLTLRKKNKQVVVAPKRVTVAVVKATRTRNRRRNNAQRTISSESHRYSGAYLNTLNNPFEFPGLKLGYDCFTTSTLESGYKRTSFLVGSTGNFALFSYPHATAGFASISADGTGDPGGYSKLAANNAVSLADRSAGARIISGGLRVCVLLPATSAPGVLGAGCFPIATQTNMLAKTAASLMGAPHTKMSLGSCSAAALMRPQDNDSFVFWEQIIKGFTTSEQSQMTVPYITGMGWPVGTTVWTEFVQNYETLPSAFSDLSSDPNVPNPEPAASDYFPSPERLFAVIKPYLASAGVTDAAQQAANSVHPYAGHAVRLAREYFGSTHGNIRDHVTDWGRDEL